MLDIPLSVYMKHHEEIGENLKIEFVMGIRDIFFISLQCFRFTWNSSQFFFYKISQQPIEFKKIPHVFKILLN